jgi:hypothetical protein
MLDFEYIQNPSGGEAESEEDPDHRGWMGDPWAAHHSGAGDVAAAVLSH